MLHATRESALSEQRGYPVNMTAVPDSPKKINEWEFNSVPHPGGQYHGRIIRKSGTFSTFQSPKAEDVPLGNMQYGQTYTSTQNYTSSQSFASPVIPEEQPLAAGGNGEGYGYQQSETFWQGPQPQYDNQYGNQYGSQGRL